MALLCLCLVNHRHDQQSTARPVGYRRCRIIKLGNATYFHLMPLDFFWPLCWRGRLVVVVTRRVDDRRRLVLGLAFRFLVGHLSSV